MCLEVSLSVRSVPLHLKQQEKAYAHRLIFVQQIVLSGQKAVLHGIPFLWIYLSMEG